MNTNQNLSQTPVASTRSNIIPLEAIHIASPCKASWAKMQGDDASRFCGSCEKHVYNLSAMTRIEAESLVAEKEGKLCVRFYQREDGTMLTSDCSVGAAAVGMRLANSRFAPLRVLATLVCALGALLPSATQAKAVDWVNSLHTAPGIGKVVNCIAPQATAGAPMMMGDIAPSQKPRKSTTTIGILAVPKPPKKPQAPPVMGKPMMPQMGEVAPTNTAVMGRIARPHKKAPHKTTKLVARKVAPKTAVARRNAAKKITKSQRGG